MFKDIRRDFSKIKQRLEQKAFFSAQVNAKTRQVLKETFGSKAIVYIKGIYPKRKDLIIEVENNLFASEIQLNLNLIKERIGFGFDRILVRVV